MINRLHIFAFTALIFAIPVHSSANQGVYSSAASVMDKLGDAAKSSSIEKYRLTAEQAEMPTEIDALEEKQVRLFKRGVYSYLDQDYEGANYLLKSLAENGHRNAQLFFGHTLHVGLGLKKEAFCWYKRSAELGNTVAALYAEQLRESLNEIPLCAEILSNSESINTTKVNKWLQTDLKCNAATRSIEAIVCSDAQLSQLDYAYNRLLNDTEIFIKIRSWPDEIKTREIKSLMSLAKSFDLKRELCAADELCIYKQYKAVLIKLFKMRHWDQKRISDLIHMYRIIEEDKTNKDDVLVSFTFSQKRNQSSLSVLSMPRERIDSLCKNGENASKYVLKQCPMSFPGLTLRVYGLDGRQNYKKIFQTSVKWNDENYTGASVESIFTRHSSPRFELRFEYLRAFEIFVYSIEYNENGATGVKLDTFESGESYQAAQRFTYVRRDFTRGYVYCSDDRNDGRESNEDSFEVVVNRERASLESVLTGEFDLSSGCY